MSQPNVERKPLEEMLAAEQENRFNYKAGVSSTIEPEVSSAESLTNRIQELDIGKTVPPTGKSTVPEKTTKTTTSSSRPLTVDEDDLDLDLEIDDTIDTTVSRINIRTSTTIFFLILYLTSQSFWCHLSDLFYFLIQPFFVHADDVNKCF